MTAVRIDWSVDEVREIFDRPLLDLVFDAARVHRGHHDPAEVQVNQLHLDQDRRLPGGLRLLLAVGAQRHRHQARAAACDVDDVSPLRKRAKDAGVSPASAWARRGAR